MRIAVIADIHGNMPALEAVLADIQRGDLNWTINLGDCVSGPLWSREVCDLLMASSILVIRGNHDRWVSGPDSASMGPSDRYAYSHLGADHRHWLGALPTSADAGNGIFACHGTPTNDNQYLVEEVSERRLVRAPRVRRRLTARKNAVLTIIGEQVSAELVAISYTGRQPLRAPTPMGDQNGPTVYEQSGSWPIPAGDTSSRPLQPKGTAEVRSICDVP
jgi:predicted phosphodiesterase